MRGSVEAILRLRTRHQLMAAGAASGAGGGGPELLQLSASAYRSVGFDPRTAQQSRQLL